MTDCRFSRLLAKLEVPLLLAVPAVMAAALLSGVGQAALAMLVVVALVETRKKTPRTKREKCLIT